MNPKMKMKSKIGLVRKASPLLDQLDQLVVRITLLNKIGLERTQSLLLDPLDGLERTVSLLKTLL